MNKTIDVIAIGNAIIDLQVSATEQEIKDFKLEKGGMKLVSLKEQEQLLSQLKSHKINKASGGSAANTVIAIAALGAKTAYNCMVGDDELGSFYIDELKALGVEAATLKNKNFPTATCAVMITPDAERTMNTFLGASAHLDQEHVSEELISKAKWLYVEGYLFSSETGQRVVEKAIGFAKKHNTKIAVTLSDGFIVEFFGVPLRKALKDAELVFSNLNEASKYTGLTEVKEVFAKFAQDFPLAVMTMSEKGALIRANSEDHFIPPFPTVATDDTGAGDMFAGAFLYGINSGLSITESGKLACFLASKVVSQLGPRLKIDLKNIVATKEYLN
ncbi:MAG: adenosine kinase [Proteobacteria bacterium]|nr:adenosine kinase [Pseudomonadota bacterium]